FLRMTASPGDCGPEFGTMCPWTRAEIEIGAAPVYTDTTVTYRFKMRNPSTNPTTGQDNLLWQLFQWDPSGGRRLWLGTRNGRLHLTNPAPIRFGGAEQVMDLGPIVYDEWHTYVISVFLSADPALGRVDLSRDGLWVGGFTGAATVVNTNLVTHLYTDVVD